ncbi:hypothetical protein B0H14DRAFT_1216184 [Mycena olivaceomarginata]|nr:hypothetical protein B0H14DRAFT_1216184 [Mycena olivaceomarginata]
MHVQRRPHPEHMNQRKGKRRHEGTRSGRRDSAAPSHETPASREGASSLSTAQRFRDRDSHPIVRPTKGHAHPRNPERRTRRAHTTPPVRDAYIPRHRRRWRRPQPRPHPAPLAFLLSLSIDKTKNHSPPPRSYSTCSPARSRGSGGPRRRTCSTSCPRRRRRSRRRRSSRRCWGGGGILVLIEGGAEMGEGERRIGRGEERKGGRRKREGKGRGERRIGGRGKRGEGGREAVWRRCEMKQDVERRGSEERRREG